MQNEEEGREGWKEYAERGGGGGRGKNGEDSGVERRCGDIRIIQKVATHETSVRGRIGFSVMRRGE